MCIGDDDVDLVMFAGTEEAHWEANKRMCFAFEYSPLLHGCWYDDDGVCVPVTDHMEFLLLREHNYLKRKNCSRELIADGSEEDKERCKSVNQHFTQFYANRFACARILNAGHDSADPLHLKLADIRRAIPSPTNPDTHVQLRSGSKRFDVHRSVIFPLQNAKINNLDIPVPRNALRFFSYFRSDEDRIPYPEYGQGCMSLAYRQPSVYYLFNLTETFDEDSFDKIREVEGYLMQCAFALHKAGYASFVECFNTSKYQ